MKLWGVVRKNDLIYYEARKKTVVQEGTVFQVFTDLNNAIIARDKRDGIWVVVDLTDVTFKRLNLL